MLEMLARFEEENGEEGIEEEGDGEDEEGRKLEREELVERLKGVDLGKYHLESIHHRRANVDDTFLSSKDSLPPDELLALLSPAQQAAFSSTLADPARINALVAQELDTESPWWIQDEDEQDESEEEEEGEDDPPRQRRNQPPALVNPTSLPQIPLNENGKPKTPVKLVFNIVAVL